MNPRERLITALGHREPDRVPLDFGTMNVTTITEAAYSRLRRYLGRIEGEQPRIVDRDIPSVEVEEDILELFHIDTRSVRPMAPANWAMPTRDDGSYVDEWGVTKRWSGLYYDAVDYPLRDATLADLKSYPWPDPNDPARYTGLYERALRVSRDGEYPIVVDPTGGVLTTSEFLRGFDAFLVDLLINRRFAEALMDRVLDFQVRVLRNLFEILGDLIDVVKIADDLGTQESLLISPALYREMIKPRHRELVRIIKRGSRAKVLLHTDGAVRPLIPDFIDIGVDILNPIQVSCSEMDPRGLKRDFGGQLSFWGGIDTHDILPRGTDDQIRREVEQRIQELAPGGGFVLASVHNIQPDVPPENLCSLFRWAYELGRYCGLHSSLRRSNIIEEGDET